MHVFQAYLGKPIPEFQTNIHYTAATDHEGGGTDNWNYETWAITCISSPRQITITSIPTLKVFFTEGPTGIPFMSLNQQFQNTEERTQPEVVAINYGLNADTFGLASARASNL